MGSPPKSSAPAASSANEDRENGRPASAAAPAPRKDRREKLEWSMCMEPSLVKWTTKVVPAERTACQRHEQGFRIPRCINTDVVKAASPSHYSGFWLLA